MWTLAVAVSAVSCIVYLVPMELSLIKSPAVEFDGRQNKHCLDLFDDN